MNPADFSFRRAMRRALLLALVAVWAAVPGVAQAAEGEPDTNLSPRLEELAGPLVRTAPRSVQAELVGLPVRGPGSLLRDGNLVLVEVRLDRGAAGAVDELEAAGGEIVDVSSRYRTVTVEAKPADLVALGHVPGVGGVTEVLAPFVRAPDCGGAVRSEGDAQLRAASARANWGVDGSGVTVGILSDSFNRDGGALTHAAGDVASGDLPGPGSPCGSGTPVGILDDSEGFGADEGRAMAQVVHDLAPGASIAFATAFHGETTFANNIRALANSGAKVIVDDVAYAQEPFFQDGPVAQAVNEVNAAGISYFSAAGNDNLIAAGKNIASWEAPAYRDSGGCPAAIVTFSEELEANAEEGLNPSHCMDFDPSVLGEDQTFGIEVEHDETLRVDLQWAEPWFGVGTDLDAFLLDESGNLLEAVFQDNVGVSQKPFEFLSWENEGPEREVRLVINRFDGEEPRLKFALLENGGGVSSTEYPESSEGDLVGPTVYGHSGSAAAISVGAALFNDDSEPEGFSSRGPVTHYFGPVTGFTPAAELSSTQTISKPDLLATDGGANTFFGPFVLGARRFFGTSAAAPHAAAVAALIRQGNPGASAAQVRADLAATARPVGAFGPDAVGAGLLDANAAVNALALPPQVAIVKAPAALSGERRPTIEFAANRPVGFACAIDGVPQPCASPFTVPTDLADGEHGIVVTGTDLAGRTGTSAPAFFRIDTRAPNATFARHPAKVVRTRKRRARASFRFRSDESGASFLCKVDRKPQLPCGSKLVRSYPVGKHVVAVRATDAIGNVDASPAVFRFRVKQIR
jgi:hypothetical protein